MRKRLSNIGILAILMVVGLLLSQCMTIYAIYHLGNRESMAIQILGIVTLLLLLLLGLGILVYTHNRQKKLSALQEGMMQQIIHDFNTPLNSMSTLMELVQEETAARDAVQEKYALIERELKNMRGASTSLLSSLSEICEARIERKLFDLKASLAELMEEQRLANRGKKEVEITLEYQLPIPSVYASPIHLLCVIRNLLDNAVKYSDDKPEVKIRCFLKGNGIMISVADRGRGIPKEQLKHIFIKYYRVTGSDVTEAKKKKEKGYGLGLAYVKRIVEAHGGNVSVTSEPGEGSTFSIYLGEW